MKSIQLLSLLFSSLMIGCGGGPDDSSQPPDIQLQIGCKVTSCDQQAKEKDRECNNCYDDCTYLMTTEGNTDCLSSCQYGCGGSLNCDPSECVWHSYTFVVNTDPDPDVQQACENVLDHDRSCGKTVDTSVCDLAAKVYRSEVAGFWDCLAGLDCDEEDGSGCLPTASDGSLADEFCAAKVAACPAISCDTGTRNLLNTMEPLLRDEASNALRSCFQIRVCGDFNECYSSWIRDIVE